jgi:hypothetical protein
MTKRHQAGLAWLVVIAVAAGAGSSCSRGAAAGGEDDVGVTPLRREDVRPGITVLLEDSIGLVRGKRVGLLTNQTGIDEHGVSDIDLLATSPRAR